MKTIEIANSEFVVYTMERLDKKYKALTAIMDDKSALHVEIINAAIQRREVHACINLFTDNDVEDESATAADILETITDTSIDKLKKQTPGGLLAQDLTEKTAILVKLSTRVAKSGVGVVGSWLVRISK